MSSSLELVALINALLAAYGGKQERLAEALEVSQATISRWGGGKVKLTDLKGHNRDRLESLAIEKGIVNYDPHDAGSGPNVNLANDMIPEIFLTGGLGGGGIAVVVNTTDNGMTFARETVRDFWRLPAWILSRFNVKPQSLAAFPVQGDSMEPTLKDGDVIFIDTQHRRPSPPGIYALADEFGGVIVKRIEVISKPTDDLVTILIQSDNPRHPPRERTLDEVAIVGRYVGRFTN